MYQKCKKTYERKTTLREFCPYISFYYVYWYDVNCHCMILIGSSRRKVSVPCEHRLPTPVASF